MEHGLTEKEVPLFGPVVASLFEQPAAARSASASAQIGFLRMELCVDGSSTDMFLI
jgi:hypothetical protein